MKHSEANPYANPQDCELPLFAGVPTTPDSPLPSRQEIELKRVKGKTADLIAAFFGAHQLGEEFHAEDLHTFVKRRADNVAPASADRVMHDMRKCGQINYEVVNRSQSLYRKLAVGM
jgi:hypothetical protein